MFLLLPPPYVLWLTSPTISLEDMPWPLQAPMPWDLLSFHYRHGWSFCRPGGNSHNITSFTQTQIKYIRSFTYNMRSCTYTRPNESIHQKFEHDMPQNLLSFDNLQQLTRIHQQSEHEVLCLFAFFLNHITTFMPTQPDPKVKPIGS